MRAAGSDRIRISEDGSIHLRSRLPKGWTARTRRTGTNPEVPGTAIMCEDEWYEVMEVHERPLGSRYILARWSEGHAMRVVDRYDDSREAERLAAHHAAVRREGQRTITTISGALVGHLPAVVQQHLANELGVSAPRLTLVSVLTDFIPFLICLHFYIAARLAEESSPVPIGFWLIAIYFVIGGIIRFQLAWMQNRPCGTVVGLIAYSLYWLLSPRRRELLSPFAEEKGTKLFHAPLSPEVVASDAYTMREPFFSLLSPAEQERLAERFGFNYRSHATPMAAVILFFSICGIGTSIVSLGQEVRLSAILSLVAGLYLAIEQVRRLLALRRGPSGSVLGVVIRPLARRFLI